MLHQLKREGNCGEYEKSGLRLPQTAYQN